MYERLGRFEIKQLLGQGAMGEVYLGRDPGIGREVAIKTILPSAAGPDARDRFAREAQAAGGLSHPNLVTVYEFGEDQGVLYIAMERVKGHDLEELLRSQALTRREGLEVLAQVCDGLGYAHAHRIVHRDIKPANVRVTRSGASLQAKVMDFGVAKVGDSGMTATGLVMGTVSYMAPEYIRTGVPEPRNDLFAVGVMLYELLSGRKPFSGDTTPTILYKIVNEPPDPLDLDGLQSISPAIRAVLDKALDKDPERRHGSADELAKALRAALDPTWDGLLPDGTVRLQAAPTVAVPAAPPALPAEPIAPAASEAAAVPARPAQTTGRSTGRTLAALGLAATLLALLGVGGWALLRGRSSAAAPTATAAGGPAIPATASATPTVPAPATGSLPVAGPLPSPATAGRPDSAVGNAPVPTPAQAAPAEPGEDLSALDGAGRRNLGMQLLSEGSALLESQPDRALEVLRRAIHANPRDPRPYAMAAAVLYRQDRFPECRLVLRQAQSAGFDRHRLAAANLQFRLAMDKEGYAHRLGGEGD